MLQQPELFLKDNHKCKNNQSPDIQTNGTIVELWPRNNGTKVNKNDKFNNKSITVETCDSSVFLAKAPFQPKAVPAAKETNKSSTPNMEPTPAEMKAMKTKLPKMIHDQSNCVLRQMQLVYVKQIQSRHPKHTQIYIPKE